MPPETAPADARALPGLFQLVSDYEPKGDQPQAIANIIRNAKAGEKFITLLGATGTGKTYTCANVIQELQRPTLVIAPNKTLAAQLFQEFKELFPNNAVRYFVSYYDYYQPEAYMPSSGRFIEKDFSINDEIDKMRLASTHALLTRRDVIIIASVSCIYGLGDPEQWRTQSLELAVGDQLSRKELLAQLVDMQYERHDVDFRPKALRVRGDIVDVFPGYLETAIRLEFFGDEIEAISEIDALTGKRVTSLTNCRIFPARHFVIPDEHKRAALESIEEEMLEQVAKFKAEGKFAEAQRIEQRTRYDLEMMEELGYCNGIENYSRHLDRRPPGTPPMTLVEYFPRDFLLVIDESHITVPQIGGMVEGDRSRKRNLVKFGFRLPSAFDNRPLTWEEFEARVNQCLFMSATPGDYEHEHSAEVIDQIIRPTGLVDPEVEVRPVTNQIDDLLAEIRETVAEGFRVLVTTLTKRMAENITDYYLDHGLRVRYLHSEIDTIERSEIIRDLRRGEFDVLVGINLLREGLDLPEVALVGILDADKEGFLRNKRSLIQTIGRAARNVAGHVVMYADKVTKAIKGAIHETNRRRRKQLAYNKKHHIEPATIRKAIQDSLSEERARREQDIDDFEQRLRKRLTVEQKTDLAEMARVLEQEMMKAAQELKFEEAAMLRDKLHELKAQLAGQPRHGRRGDRPSAATTKEGREPPQARDQDSTGPRGHKVLTYKRRPASPETPAAPRGPPRESSREPPKDHPKRTRVGLVVLPERVTFGRTRQAPYSQVGGEIRALVDWFAAHDFSPPTEIHVRYLDDPRFVDPDETRFEVFVPLSPAEHATVTTVANHAPYEITTREGAEVAAATHHGDPTRTGETYQAIFRWLQRRRYKSAGPATEVYPADFDPAAGTATSIEIRVPVERVPRRLERVGG